MARFPRSARLPPDLLTVGLAGCLAWSAGCSTAPVHSARDQFYRGQIEEAETALELDQLPEKDPVLFLVERGTIRQAAGHYEKSAEDFVAAAARLEALETYSLSEGAGSLVINDTVQEFQGKPYEQTMLHSMAALSYLATGAWDDAAVEARQLVARLDRAVEAGFPDDPYSRYLAGVCFEMIDDRNAAEIEYRKAAASLEGILIEEQGGALYPAGQEPPVAPEDLDHELVCFVMLGGAPRGAQGAYAELYADERLLGRTYPLTDVAALAAATRERLAALRAAKTTGRIVIKESIAQGVDGTAGDGWGDLTRLVLIGLLERPDLRRWETLPGSFQVARVPCPADLKAYTVQVKDAGGSTVREFSLDRPLMRRRRTYVSFCRDIAVSP